MLRLIMVSLNYYYIYLLFYLEVTGPVLDVV